MLRVLIGSTIAMDPLVRKQSLGSESYKIDLADGVKEIYSKVQARPYYELATFIWTAPQDGLLDLVKTVRSKGIRTHLLAIVEGASVEQAVQAMKAGVDDFSAFPFAPADLVQYIGDFQGKVHPSPHYLANRLDRFVQRNCGKPTLGLEDLSRNFSISADYASKLFLKHIGIAFSQRLRFFRIQRAKAMIESSNEPLYLIASHCGFKHPCRLTEAFKFLEGIGPKTYRQIRKDLVR